MKEPYDVKITRAGKPVLEFKSNMVAVVGITKSTTLCSYGDWELRILLAARVQLYLDSLKKTVKKDTCGLIDSAMFDDLIAMLNESTETIEKTVDLPETFSELIARLKGEDK